MLSQRTGQLCIAVTFVLPAVVLCAPSSYDCTQTGHTNIGWSTRRQQYTGVAQTAVDKPTTVKLSDIGSDRPYLTGQGVVRLLRISVSGTVSYFIERAVGGTPILWTLFEKEKSSGAPTAVLVSTKTYDFLGPVSFTDFYSCNSNEALSSK